MRRHFSRFLRFLNTPLWTKKPLLDEAARREQLKTQFLRSPTVFFVGAIGATLSVTSGVLPILPAVGCVLGGVIATKETLWTMRCPPDPSKGFMDQLRNYKLGWGFLGLMCYSSSFSAVAEKLHGWLWFLGLLGAISSMLAGQSLLLWVFREPFWQFVTGTPWPEEPSSNDPQQPFESVYYPRPHAPVAPQPSLPFDY